MSDSGPIRHISDTALWVAVYRAQETARPDAVFRDPYAALLAGDRGRHIAATMAAAGQYAWSYVARTWLVDRAIEADIARGADTVVNLAAGLDARPYRMDLPSSLRWIEVDLPDMIAYKAERLASERPRCRLERIPLDLADRDARRALFDRIGAESARAFIVTEGLIIYLVPDRVPEFALDLAAQRSFCRWATDLTSPRLLRMLDQTIGQPLANAGSPLRFAPREGPAFFDPYGWRVVRADSLLHAAARLKRLSFRLRLFSLLPDSHGRRPDTPWGGVCELENRSAA